MGWVRIREREWIGWQGELESKAEAPDYFGDRYLDLLADREELMRTPGTMGGVVVFYASGLDGCSEDPYEFMGRKRGSFAPVSRFDMTRQVRWE